MVVFNPPAVQNHGWMLEANDPHKSMSKSKELETHNHLPSSSTTFKASITLPCHAPIQGQDWFSWPGKSLETHNISVIHAESSRHKALLPLPQILRQEAHFVRCWPGWYGTVWHSKLEGTGQSGVSSAKVRYDGITILPADPEHLRECQWRWVPTHLLLRGFQNDHNVG